MDSLVIGLIVYCVVRELFFLYSTHKLINKILSRSYYEYKMAENGPTHEPATYKGPVEEPEDLGPLTAFN